MCFLGGVGRQAGGQRWGHEVVTKDAVLVTAQLGCVCVREEGSREGRRATRACVCVCVCVCEVGKRWRSKVGINQQLNEGTKWGKRRE